MTAKISINESLIAKVSGNTIFVSKDDMELHSQIAPLVVKHGILKHYRATEDGDVYIFQTATLLTLIRSISMPVYLGNMSVEEIEDRVGVKFVEELKTFLSERKQENASDIQPGKWHCFDIPFTLVCGDIETAEHIYNLLDPLNTVLKTPLLISIQTR